MKDWRRALRADPLPPLLQSGHPALEYFARRDLLDEDLGTPEGLWCHPVVAGLVRRQQPDGSWKYPGGGKAHLRPVEDYSQLETYRCLGVLVEKFGATRRMAAIRQAAAFLFSRQTEAGDFRGIYGNQSSPNYTAGIIELLIKAGYAADRRTRKGMRWLISARQEDGGWAIPMSTVGARWDVKTLGGPTLAGDRSRPFSHLATGVVLRAFAAHPAYRPSSKVRLAGELLASRFFLKDAYPGRDTPEFWTKLTYPFWFTDLLSALDSLSLLGFGRENPQIARALDWFVERQGANGTWSPTMLRSGGDNQAGLWIALAICRVLKRLGGRAAARRAERA
jgi:hypothetical protein